MFSWNIEKEYKRPRSHRIKTFKTFNCWMLFADSQLYLFKLFYEVLNTGIRSWNSYAETPSPSIYIHTNLFVFDKSKTAQPQPQPQQQQQQQQTATTEKYYEKTKSRKKSHKSSVKYYQTVTLTSSKELFRKLFQIQLWFCSKLETKRQENGSTLNHLENWMLCTI